MRRSGEEGDKTERGNEADGLDTVDRYGDETEIRDEEDGLDTEDRYGEI